MQTGINLGEAVNIPSRSFKGLEPQCLTFVGPLGRLVKERLCQTAEDEGEAARPCCPVALRMASASSSSSFLVLAPQETKFGKPKPRQA